MRVSWIPPITLTAPVVMALAITGRPVLAAEPAANVVVSNQRPLGEGVFFCFDTSAFPTQEDVKLELIQGQNPRRVVPTGPKGSHDEHWGYHTILRIGDRFHLWVMTQSAQWTQYLCYATSKDGITWEKPELGLVELDGSRKNNIIESPFKMRSPSCQDILTVFLVHFDPDDPRPERRYKMAAQMIQGGAGKLAIAFSPDGLRWKAGPEPKSQFMEMGGSIKFNGSYYMTGQSTMPRRLNVFSSTDFENWTDLGSGFSRDHLPPLEKEEPSPLPDADQWPPAGTGKGEQVHCGAGLWDRGNVILGVYDAWHGRERDRRLITMDLGLVVSHDAVKYTEPVESFRLVDARKQPHVPPHGPALTCGKLGNIGDKTLCWYTWWHPPEGHHGTYAVTWDRDRLGLLKPTGENAKVVSGLVHVTTGSAGVYLNASGLDRDNRLRVSLLDEKDQPLAGFSGAGAAVVAEPGLRVPVAWKGGKAISADMHRVRIQVAFEGGQGRLHAIYVGGEPADPAPPASLQAKQARGPLRVHPTNPRYFTDGTKLPDGSLKAVYLTGSHTWGNLCDAREGRPAFDFPGYLDFLERRHHNFIRLWSGDAIGQQPIPYARTGPGTAKDGGPKVDLDRFDPVFFDRLRSRLIAARERGIYVGIMLFNPDSGAKRKDWNDLLYHPANNVHGLDADTNGDGSGAEAYDLSIPRITAYQEAFARKVVDTVNDLDNVLYEIGNEGDFTSVPWQHHFIRLIQGYQARRPKQHPVGMTAVFNILDGSWATDNRPLFESPADWISPGLAPYQKDPPPADGKKVIIADVDHIWPAAPHRGWIWKCLLRGIQPILMDQYCYGDPKWTSPAEQEAMRDVMGYALTYADKVNLAAMTPRSELATTAYCLAHPGNEYLVYQPLSGEPFSMELKAGKYRYEWFDPAKGAVTGSGDLESSGGAQRLKAPFQGEAVLYLRAAGHPNTEG